MLAFKLEIDAEEESFVDLHNRRKETFRINNLKILNEIKEIYYQNTGMIVSFHLPLDANIVNIDFYPDSERSDFCKLIHSSKKGYDRCLESDKYGLRLAKKNRGYAIYKCHAGLTDIAIPIFYKRRYVGAIYTGQVVTEPHNDIQFGKIYERVEDLSIDYDELRESYYRVKYVPYDKLRFMVRLLSLMANYIVGVESELFLQRELIKKTREIYKKEKERIRLEKELKDLTISILEHQKKGLENNGNYSKDSNYIIAKAQLFIKDNLQKNLKLDEVAKAIYLSPNYFSYLFKVKTGYTFSQYLNRVRIERSKDLLKNTDLSIKEIVFSVGFNDYNYFNKVFKNIVGIPPAKFRKTS